MIENIEVTSGGKLKLDENFKKYAIKRIGKLSKYLPSKTKKGTTAKVVVKEINRPHGNKYEISVALDIPGGKILTARDEAGNIFAGIDILEAKLSSQIRRFKIESSPHLQKPKKRLLRKVFRRKFP